MEWSMQRFAGDAAPVSETEGATSPPRHIEKAPFDGAYQPSRQDNPFSVLPHHRSTLCPLLPSCTGGLQRTGGSFHPLA